MNKSIAFLMILGFSMGSLSLSAQTWDELFRQKETQKEYLILQLGALRIQSGLLNKAGQIASVGWNTISSWRDMEKSLHEGFFDSFKFLGPLATAALDRLNDAGVHPYFLRERISKSHLFWFDQSQDVLFLHWTDRVHQGMMNRCDSFAAELQLITGKGLDVGDADRADMIDLLAKHLLVLQRDLSSFQKSSQIRLAQQRYRDYELQLLNRF